MGLRDVMWWLALVGFALAAVTVLVWALVTGNYLTGFFGEVVLYFGMELIKP